MLLKQPLTVREGFLPTPRHRVTRYRDVQEEFTGEIQELDAAAAPVVLTIVYRHPALHHSTRRLDYRLYDGRLWQRFRIRKLKCLRGNERNIWARPSHLWLASANGCGPTPDRDEMAQRIASWADGYRIIDGQLYRQKGEPLYQISTFGLGGNHGLGWGTSMGVTHCYNSNLPHWRYYRVDQEEQAREAGRRIAEDRGDTKAFTHFDNRVYDTFEIHDASVLRRDPPNDHGDGDPFLNQVDEITRVKDPALASLMVMSVAGSGDDT